MKTLTVIDTFGFFFRNYYALPSLKSKSGFPTGLLTGFVNFIATLNKEHDTDYLLFALDSKEKTWRKELDPNYKANRPTPPEDLKTQLPVAIDWIEKMGFKQIVKPGFEADDVIASIVSFAKSNNLKVKIVSHDKDLYQLIEDDKVIMYDPIKKIEINEDRCLEKFGVESKYIVDYLAIVGDAADNIPGVKGVGAKGAKTLINEFGTLEDIYKNIENIRNPRTQKLLLESQENAILSKKLALLHHSLIESCDLDEFRFPDKNPILNIADELIKYDMTAILKRAGATYANNNKKEESIKKESFKPILLDTKKKLLDAISNIEENSIVAFDTETNSLDAKSAKIVGFSFASNESEAYYVPISHNYLGVTKQVSMEDAKIALNRLMGFKIVGQNLKYDFAVLYNNFDFKKLEVFADTMIISWLLDPSLSAGLDNMAKRYFSYEMVKFKDVVKKGENFSHVDISSATNYASEDAWMTLKLYNFLNSKMSQTLQYEAKEVEYPFVDTLIKMERRGIKLDIDFFEMLLKKATKSIEALTKDIYTLSESEFNINSTKQLGVILFENLGLKTGKKTKTGYSTDEKVLNSLIEDHDIIPKLLEYREIYKLRSTYIDPLLKLAKKDENNRIYTSFLQTGTATGRLSSKNPNLQNIPSRSELGREIRQGFIAQEEYLLVGIDYSQIELRLLAHFSQDKALLDAFINDKDIHLETAAKIFGEDKAKEKRNIAKSINFGLLYGMGARKLSQTINVSQKEAKEYIESYFNSFPTVKNHIQQIQSDAKENGYVETLLGRRRIFDYDKANAFVKASFERESVNTLFQGSAADLMKLSMNKINYEIDESEAKMLLQIHDELIFEIKEDLAQEFALKIKDIMENIYELKVPLKCSISINKNWGGLK